GCGREVGRVGVGALLVELVVGCLGEHLRRRDGVTLGDRGDQRQLRRKLEAFRELDGETRRQLEPSVCEDVLASGGAARIGEVADRHWEARAQAELRESVVRSEREGLRPEGRRHDDIGRLNLKSALELLLDGDAFAEAEHPIEAHVEMFWTLRLILVGRGHTRALARASASPATFVGITMRQSRAARERGGNSDRDAGESLHLSAASAARMALLSRASGMPCSFAYAT